MSFDLNIYTKNLSIDLISKIKKRFNDFDMNIEFHPDFNWNVDGFLPIKFKLKSGISKLYDNFENEILSGFEIYCSENEFDESHFTEIEDYDKLLESCYQEVHLSCGINDSGFRLCLFFAAFLAELTEGVIFDPQEGRFLNAKEALNTFPKEIIEYENSIKFDQFNAVPFDSWD